MGRREKVMGHVVKGRGMSWDVVMARERSWDMSWDMSWDVVKGHGACHGTCHGTS